MPAGHACAVGELAVPHPLEEVQVLLDRAVPPRAVAAGLGERAAVLADLVGREIVHVGLAGADEMDGPGVELLEVVRRVEEVLAPVEAEPAHVRLDGVDVRLLLPFRIGVVETEVAAAAELARDAEIEADRLRMPDVQVAVGLGRKARDDRGLPTVAQVGGHDVADEVGALWVGRGLEGHVGVRARAATSGPWGRWLASKDSNLESPDPESGALPFGHSPVTVGIVADAIAQPARGAVASRTRPRGMATSPTIIASTPAMAASPKTAA